MGTMRLYRSNVLKDEKTVYAVLGVENQANIHYAMPIKTGLYDFMNYSGQAEEAEKSYRTKDEKSDGKDRISMYNGLEVRVPFCDYRMEEYLYGVPLGIQGLPLIRKKPAEGNHEGIPAGKNSMAQEKSLPKDAPSGIFSCSVESARRTGVGRLRAGLADRPA